MPFRSVRYRNRFARPLDRGTGAPTGGRRNFPKDCCHHAAALLRLYLFDQGLGLFDKAEGRRPDGREHVWVRQNDIVIDITADQFDEGQAKVIVTRHSPWHAAWQLAESRSTDEAMLNCSRDFYSKQYPVYPLILTNVNA